MDDDLGNPPEESHIAPFTIRNVGYPYPQAACAYDGCHWAQSRVWVVVLVVVAVLVLHMHSGGGWMSMGVVGTGEWWLVDHNLR